MGPSPPSLRRPPPRDLVGGEEAALRELGEALGGVLRREEPVPEVRRLPEVPRHPEASGARGRKLFGGVGGVDLVGVIGLDVCKK